ncbi:glycosyltransferase family 4 protein [Caulobacter sp. KR2-114]|uniref:glycosyltransferase family 4 protein n=1 Tax=Caulobacter sp. KR2-114 TaxID=3400912 RepID=UPI003BFE5C31
MTRLLFDASRLLLRANRATPTGIDRVALAYGRWLLSRNDVDLAPVWGLGGALAPMGRTRFARLIDEAMPGVGAPRGESAAWRALKAALAAAPDSGRPLRRDAWRRGANLRSAGWYAGALLRAPMLAGGLRAASAGSTYLNVCHFGLEQPDFLRRLAARRVRSVVMIHDLIPIRRPEFCGPGAAARHVVRMDAALEHAALIIANSEATASDIRDYAAETGRAAPPIQVAPLGVEDAFRPDVGAPTAERPYFVCVGTIEPRKNLAFLLTLWRRLAERRGEATPRLVLVGRRGWEYEAVVDHLERSPPVLRWVHEVSDLHDDELAALVRGATALLAPSLIEGFDFTTLEALSLGTPVLASDIPAHRELAIGARLVDPTDGPAWLEAIEAAIDRPAPPGPFAPPRWDDHFALVGRAMGLNVPTV